MNKRKNRWIQKGLAWVLTLAMVLGTVVMSDLTAVVAQAAEISLTESAGYEEGAYVEWAPVDGADGYIVYTSKDGGTTWSAIDDQLIRKYADHYRADALGLTAGTWQLKVEAATFDTDKNKTSTVAEKTTDNLTVTNYDRSGFAFSTASRVNPSEGLGAYNADGSLKSGAQVIYVTAATAKTVKATVNGTEVTGLQEILAAKEKKNTSGDILDIRIIGKVSLADLDSISSKEEGLQIKGSGDYADMNITIEGVGEDAVVYGFGMLVRNCSDVELRNFGLMYFLDDGISLDTKNSNIWVHDLDIFYGQPGSASDQVKGDGSVDLKGDSQYLTISYNHFYDSGKCSLCGMKSESGPNYITYHHNWFDHSDSRHPRIRTMSVHVYNNYYDGNAKYGVGAAYQSSAFVENNYFRNCKNPMLSSQQGSDRYDGEVTKKDSGIFPNSKGTFSGEDGGIIKAYNNVMEGKYTFIPYGSDTYIRDGAETAFDLMYVSSDKTDVSTSATVDFDAYVVTDRATVVPDTVTAKQGGSKYTNFDTEVDLGVALTAIDAPEDVPEKVTAKAGRLKGTDGKGDFDWSFDNSVDDTSAAVNDALKTAVANYTSSLVAVGGIAGASTMPVYTVTFDPANGEATWNVEVDAGQKVAEPAAPTVPADKESFDGWYNGTTKWNFNNTVTADMTLTAKYLAAGETPASGDASVIIHDFTKDGTTSTYFAITGNINSNAGTSGEYNGKTYSGKGLKMESSTAITFTAASAGTLVLVHEAGFTGKTKIDNQASNAVNGIISAAIAAGEREITKGDKTTLYAIYFIPEGGSLEDPTDPEDTETLTFDASELEVTEYTADFTKGAFTIHAGDGKDANNKNNQSVIVDENAKTVDGVSYTKRLKTGGAGTADYRSIEFTTTGKAEVSIVAMSGNSAETRALGLGTKNAADNTFTDVTSFDVAGDSAKAYTYTLDEAGTYYVYSKASGVNIYGIKVVIQKETDPTTTKYTVTFNSNGGSAVASQKVTEGSKATAPAAPTKEGFLFDGWYTDAALTQAYDFSTAVTADLILYAKWKDDPAQNTVTIKLNASDLEEKEYLETFTQGEFTIHAGDGKDDKGANNQSVTVDASNKTVDGVKYTRRLKTGGAGTADYRSIAFTTTGKAEVTIVAASSSSSVDRVMGLATKNAEDGTLADVTTFTVTGAVATFTYTLNTAGTYYIYSHQGGINFYAVTVVMEKTSTPAPATYTVTFNANGGSAVAAQTVESGKTATAPAAPTKDNFDFGGWYTDENCTTAYDFATPVTADITLYAKWTQKTIPSTDGDDKGLYVKLADPEAEYVYTGKAIAPAIIVTNNGEELVAGVDYTVKYSNNVNAAAKDAKKAPTVTVTGKGNLTGKATQTFTILPKSLLDEDVQAQPVVTSNAAKAVPVIVYNGMTLKKNKDFTFQYNAETKEFAVIGAGNYVTEKDAPLMISVVEKAASDLKKFAVTVGKEKLYYNGAEQTPVVTVMDAKDKTRVLAEGTDYVIAWPLDTTNAGTVKFNVIGLGDYASSVAKSYKINPLAATAEVKTDVVAKDGYTFDAKGVTIGQDLALTVQTTVDGQKTTLELVEGKDYTVSYSANKKVGTNTAKYTFKFLGNFKGTKAAAGTFSIVPASLADLHEDGLVQVAAVGKTAAKAGVYKTVPYVSVNGTALKKSDMILTYYIDEEMTKEMTKATPVEVGGTVYVKIVGKGNYAAKDAGDFVSTVYKVVSVDKTKDLSKAKILTKTGAKLGKQEYTGEEIKPAIKVMIGVAEVPEDAYTLTYVNNVNKGKATIVITAVDDNAGGYAGSKAQNFSIVSRNLKNVTDLFKKWLGL